MVDWSAVATYYRLAQVGAGVAELKAWATPTWDKMSEIFGKLSE